MPSLFDASATRALDRNFAVFGLAATYTNRDAVATACTVLVSRDLTRSGEAAAAIAQHTGLVEVRVAEVPSPPRRSETFTLADTGEVFTVDSLQASTEYLHRVIVS